MPRSLSSNAPVPPERQRKRRPWFALVLLLSLATAGVVVWNELSHRQELREPEQPPPPPAQSTDGSQEVVTLTPGDTVADTDSDSDVVAVAPAPEAIEQIDPAAQLLNRRRAEDVLSGLLERTRTLEEQGVTEWGGETYAQVLARSRAGDRRFIEEQYEAAIAEYDEAVAACDVLAARIPEAFEQMLDEGNAALARANAAAARRAFDAALKLDPSSEAAKVGRVRADTIEKVTTLMASGATHEDRGRFALALTDYRDAAQLDPLSEEAATAAQRVGEAIQLAEFTGLMTQGLRSLREGDLDDAEALFEKAEMFFPDAPEVNDALFQVEEARRLARIREHQENAEEAERREDWRLAYDGYQQILAIDPHIRSAQEGKERNASRVRLQAQMRHYLDRPEELQSDSGRRAAILTLEEARERAETGEQWRTLLATFEERVTLATTPVPVVIESDGLTSIDIYKVGRFAPFETKSLSLLPGTYTLIGHRNGYKDVRIQLTVPAGEEPVPVPVQCTERIR